MLNLAQVLNDELPPMVDWYNNEIKRLNIDVRLNTKARRLHTSRTSALTRSSSLLVLKRSSPDVPGKNRKNVIDSHALKALVEGKGTPGKGVMWSHVLLRHGRPRAHRWAS